MNAILIAAMSVTGTLLGVLVGGWLTSRNQKRERRVRLFREQIGEFYGPMLAMRAEVLAKSELRVRIGDAAAAAWQGLLAHGGQGDSNRIKREEREASFPIFEEIIKYNNRQFAEEIMPIYRNMVKRFTEKMHFAEISTIGYLATLIDFVEIWTRWLAESLPGEVIEGLGHSEEKLFPFYSDLASHFVELQEELSETRAGRWRRRRKRSASINVLPSR